MSASSFAVAAREWHAAGYRVFPVRNGHPAIGGIYARPTWYYHEGDELPQFEGCTVGILTAARPHSGASGPATLSACAGTWCATVRFEHEREAAIVERIAGPGVQMAGIRLYKVEHTFTGAYLTVPRRFEVLCLPGWFEAIGSPPMPRNALPTLTREQAYAIIGEVTEGALWR